MRCSVIKPWFCLAAGLALAAPAGIVLIPAVAMAQSQAGRTLSPADVRELRQQLGSARTQRDAARRQAAANRTDYRRVIAIFGLPDDTSATTVAEQLERWAEQDRTNRDELARLAEIVGRIDSGEIRNAAEHHLQTAQAAFDQGRLDDADQGLAELEFLRRSGSAEASQLWVDAVIARSALADQRFDGETARRLAREARLEARARSNHEQWRLAIREAQSYELEDPHRRDNRALEAAVALYRDEALPLLDRDRDTDDWAMTQNNLGNALAQLGEREAGTARLEEAVTAYRAALEKRTRERVPLYWAMTQNNLGSALQTLGGREAGTARLEEALTAYQAALEERTRERAPLDWAGAQNNLGNALRTLGARETGTVRLEEAVTAYRAALEERTRERVPLQWAATQNNLGNALQALGARETGTVRLEEAVTAYRAALEERTRERVPLQWAATQNNLGNALQALGEREAGMVRLEEAATAYRAALEERTRERVPLDWAGTQNNLGNALQTLGEREAGTARLGEAVTAYQAALEEYTRERVPLQWAMTQYNLGNVLQARGEREAGTVRLEDAVTAYRAALEERTRERVPLQWAMTLHNSSRALGLISSRTEDWRRFREMRDGLAVAADIYEQAGQTRSAETLRSWVALIDEQPR